MIFFLVEGLVKVIDLELIDDILNDVIGYVLKCKLCLVGDFIVVFYCIGVVFVIKIMEVKELIYFFLMV